MLKFFKKNQPISQPKRLIFKLHLWNENSWRDKFLFTISPKVLLSTIIIPSSILVHLLRTSIVLMIRIPLFQIITDQLKSEELNTKVTNDWKFAAMVIDRMCLIIFTLFTIIATITVLLSAPHIIVTWFRYGQTTGSTESVVDEDRVLRIGADGEEREQDRDDYDDDYDYHDCCNHVWIQARDTRATFIAWMSLLRLGMQLIGVSQTSGSCVTPRFGWSAPGDRKKIAMRGH